jgi:hypothetical protein
MVVVLRELSLENHKFFLDVVGPEAKTSTFLRLRRLLKLFASAILLSTLGLAIFNLSLRYVDSSASRISRGGGRVCFSYSGHR